ncbi:MAG: hypothetical protein ABI779_27660, partial [Acidobacteriota bacterium]
RGEDAAQPAGETPAFLGLSGAVRPVRPCDCETVRLDDSKKERRDDPTTRRLEHETKRKRPDEKP